MPDGKLEEYRSENSADTKQDVANSQSRRTVLASGSTVLMVGGLAGGYGAFFAMACRYFFPSGRDKAWMFVANADSIQPGESVSFESPAGVKVAITRRTDATDKDVAAENFLALSSVCPHLGCRVSWEPHNDRFFCPCHNGVFAPDGTAMAGPPAADGQDLARYPLMVADGALYIEMPYRSV